MSRKDGNMDKQDRIIEVLTEENECSILYTGMNEALLGVYRNPDLDYAPVAVYSYTKYIEILTTQGMDEEEAIEFFDFNVVGGYLGIHQPIIIDDTGV